VRKLKHIIIDFVIFLQFVLLTKFFILDNQFIFDKFDWFWYKSFNNLPINPTIKTTQVIQFALFKIRNMKL